MAALNSQTMTAAMAATILGDIQELVDRLELLDQQGVERHAAALASLEAVVKQLDLAKNALGNTNSDIYNKLLQSLTETADLRKDMRRLIEENRVINRRYNIAGAVAAFSSLALALLGAWVIWG
ncbi:hypothetical protein [Acinetobacter variabilis]|uniref:hypothetical protein n=1 Tax=Acinetobacter variabilis TaxID=70346 RepID=UPI0028B01391|nr:hypothetical protein [Acinetobacter variabilis]